MHHNLLINLIDLNKYSDGSRLTAGLFSRSVGQSLAII
jgi:hypothetical protein